MSPESSTPSLPGTTPSPFDPTPPRWEPWPPLDRLAAIGIGEYAGALARELGALLATDATDPQAFAAAQIQSAQADGRLSEKDARLLLSHVTRRSATDSAAGPAPTAAELFRQALDDPATSPLTLALLSLAKYREETSPVDSVEGVDPVHAFGWGIAVASGAAPMIVAMHVVDHLSHIKSVTVTFEP